MALLVLVVDRDDDVGVKAGLETPLIGREEVLKAGESLLLADPEDSDGNTIFAAVKTYDELLSKGNDVEVAIVSGDPHLGIVADMKIRKQLERIFSDRNYEGIVFVSDGAEDDQVLPIVSSFAPIVSKRTVIVRQAEHLERAFYTIKTALEDPSFARLFLGIPGLLLLLWILFQENALRLIAGILGIYMVIRGFGIEEPLINTLKAFLTFDPHSPSLPFQLVSLALLLAGTLISLHTAFNMEGPAAVYESLRLEGSVAFLSIVIFLLGKSIEAVYKKQSYRIGDYLLFSATILVAYIIGDALINFLEGVGSSGIAVFSGIVSLLIYYMLASISSWIKRAPLLSKEIIGAPVFDRTGVKVGKIKKVDGNSAVVERGKQRLRVPLNKIKILGNRLVIT